MPCHATTPSPDRPTTNPHCPVTQGGTSGSRGAVVIHHNPGLSHEMTGLTD